MREASAEDIWLLPFPWFDMLKISVTLSEDDGIVIVVVLGVRRRRKKKV